jgi:hypothetical protein
MELVIFFSFLISMIFLLRFILFFKSRNILARIKKEQLRQTGLSQTGGPDMVTNDFMNQASPEFHPEIRRWMLYQKILTYIRLFTIIALVIVGILMAML